MSITIHHGDSREVLKTLADASVDSVVCDPPYALVSIGKRLGKPGAAPIQHGKDGACARAARGFMGKTWDTGETAFAVEFWAEVYRVLKPGGHVVAFSGTRTYHRLACAIEDAGFEIRDMLSWLYGSGFPKSHDVSKGIDKAAGAARDVVGPRRFANGTSPRATAKNFGVGDLDARSPTHGMETAPATPDAQQWSGWGTALKPACEPIVFARKPLGTCGVNVVDVVEFGLRNQGVEGEIRWTSEPANGAAKIASRRTSSSTVQPPAGETSAAPVGGSETGNGERPTARSSALTGGSGATPTLAEAGSTAEPLTPSSAPKSSPHTAVTANVAESKSKPSSPSITSTAAEPNTGGAFTAKSTPSCDASDSPATDTGCFAGIATGLTGSLAHVHISRNLDGSFVWPKGLPKRLDPQPLTVASNVLAHGTGAINIDATRIHSDDAQGGEYTVKRLKPGATLDKTGGNWRPENGPEFVGNMKPGRWPANVIHDGSDEVVAAFPSAPGQLAPVGPKNGAKPTVNTYGDYGPREQFNPRGDSGSAARFFYAAEPDDLCGLCGCPSGAFSGKLSPCNANAAEPSSPTENTPSADTAPCDAAVSQPPVREVKNLASSDLATDAEIPSSRHRRVGSDTAAGPAATPGLSSLAQNVMSAGSLCGSCATAIAQSLAATQRGQSPASLPCPASIDGRSWQILTSSLALHVEGRESTDTTTTIPSLKLLLGSVFHAIGDTTRPAKSAALANTESGPKRFHYSSKADATDRLGSKHPTVKPTDLMRWLVRLVTPPGGVVLDPFAGSGSTGVACVAEGFDAILIEREDEYVADIHRRIAWAKGEGRLTAQEKAKKPDLGLEGLSLFGDAA